MDRQPFEISLNSYLASEPGIGLDCRREHEHFRLPLASTTYAPDPLFSDVDVTGSTGTLPPAVTVDSGNIIRKRTGHHG